MNYKEIRMNERFQEISQLWVRDSPFYSEFMMRFHFFETEDIETFGVNCTHGNINLFFNSKYLYGGLEFYKFDDNGKPIIKRDSSGKKIYKNGKLEYEKEIHPGLINLYSEDSKKRLKSSELEAILVHEILHLVLLSQERSLDDAWVWNIASDMIINDMITKMKIGDRKLPLPKGGVYLDDAIKRGFKGEAITEEVYEWLIEKRNSMTKKACSNCNGTGEKDGSQCPQCHGHGEEDQEFFESLFNSKIDDHRMLNDCDNLTESVISDISSAAKSKGWGSVTGSGVEMIDALFNRPKVNWKQELRKLLSPFVHGSGLFYEDSWCRPNRRGFPLPGNKKLNIQLLFAIDVSGSVTSEELEQYFIEIETIIKDVQKITLIQWDTEIKSVVKYKKGGWRTKNTFSCYKQQEIY
jgi:predicted metal-dependent peptidase